MEKFSILTIKIKLNGEYIDMWEAIQGILTSGNFLKSVVGIGMLVALLAFLAKKGIISFKGKGLSIGNGDLERSILRQQIEYTKSIIDTFVEKVGYTEENVYCARYVSELVLDLCIEMIVYNHIDAESDFYWRNKAEKAWSIIVKYAASDRYKTDAFKVSVFEEMKKLITHLVEIRIYYTKRGC